MKNTILLIDDEVFNLDLLTVSLEALQEISILRAANGQEGLKIISEASIDLIILDISMPGMDGLEVLEVLKSKDQTRFIPVIMVTAKNEERHNALKHGSEDFLSKPIDVIELKFKVNNLLKLKKFNDLQQFFNKRLEEEISKKEQQIRKFAQIEQELEMAKSIQESLLPGIYPKSDILDIYGACIQAHEVGGDYYDVFETECKRYTICVMADVSGHGIASALIAMQFRTLVRAELGSLERDFAFCVERINTILSQENNEASMFITALLLRFDHTLGIIESVNAGHYNPLGSIEMKHNSGIPFGIMPHIEYEVLETPFQKGRILLYTDGIIEGENSHGEMYEANFYKDYATLASLSSQEQIEGLLVQYHAYVEKQIDDVTLLAIHLHM